MIFYCGSYRAWLLIFISLASAHAHPGNSIAIAARLKNKEFCGFTEYCQESFASPETTTATGAPNTL